MTAEIVSLRPKDELSAGQKFDCLPALLALAKLVTAQEYCILSFVYMRSVFWGKREAYIPMRHFVEGVYDTDGICVTPSILKDERYTRRLVNSLLKKDFLRRDMRGGTGGYPYYSLNLEKGFAMLRQPKEKKNKAAAGLKTPKKGGEGKIYLGGEGKIYPPTDYDKTNYDKNKCEPSAAHSPADACESLKERVLEVGGKSKTRRAEKLATAKTRSGVADLERVWTEAARAAYPEMPLAGWTMKERGQIKNFRDALVKESGVRASEFLVFAAENWARIAALYFSRGKVRAPQYPDISFLMGLKKSFLHAFADSAFNQRQLKASSEERKIAKYVRMGYTEAQAEKMIGGEEKEIAAIRKAQDAKDKAEMDNRALLDKNRLLEKEKRELEIARGREIQQQERLNRGSKPEKKKAAPKYDAEGFAEFDAEQAPKWEDE